MKIEEIIKITPRYAKRVFDPMVEEVRLAILMDKKNVHWWVHPQKFKRAGCRLFIWKVL